MQSIKQTYLCKVFMQVKKKGILNKTLRYAKSHFAAVILLLQIECITIYCVRKEVLYPGKQAISGSRS